MNAFKKRMAPFHETFVVNWHEHVRESSPGMLDEAFCDRLVCAADTLGIDRLVCSIPIGDAPHCPPKDFRRVNDVLAKAMRRHPGRIFGMGFINPGYGAESLGEICRCVEELGMIGVKLYQQYFINEPVQFPVIELCAKLDVPVLVHSGMVYDPLSRVMEPRISHGGHFANIASRYPEVTLIMAHIGGGGDWQGTLKPIAHMKNVLIDISGSVYDSPMIEEAARVIGVNRVLFGTDGSFSHCVGKLLGARLSDGEKRVILEGTAALRFLNTRGVLYDC